MNRYNIQRFIALAGLSATAAYATQPPDTVASDNYANTAMGTSALLNDAPPAPYACVPFATAHSLNGCYNTAAGFSALAANTTGYMNTALGSGALAANTIGTANTAVGALALYSENGNPGSDNSAFGAWAMFSDSSGRGNTAAGGYALYHNTTGSGNTVSGFEAMKSSTAGNFNVASGYGVMWTNASGSYNTATGAYALYGNITGANHTAVGYQALFSNSGSGNNNTAIGYQALAHNTTGYENNAQGYQALFNNTTGRNNAAMGEGALYTNTSGYGNNGIGLTALENLNTGNRNTAVGNNAGLNLGQGSYNTYIGWGVMGAPNSSTTNENYVTRIGVTYVDPSVNVAPTTYIAGIYDSAVTDGLPVYVTASGQLGFSASSERFKTDIAPMPEESAKLQQLRPVTFKYKTDAKGTMQYGLIAEEVAKVYPELVIRGENGRIDGVRYDELAPMLLSEAQMQQGIIDTQARQIADMQKQLAELRDLKRELTAVLGELGTLRAGQLAQR